MGTYHPSESDDVGESVPHSFDSGAGAGLLSLLIAGGAFSGDDDAGVVAEGKAAGAGCGDGEAAAFSKGASGPAWVLGEEGGVAALGEALTSDGLKKLDALDSAAG